ncbi:MAG: isoprenylcysteine carboxylmethyltransferase family protein [Spirochaetia bacterium]
MGADYFYKISVIIFLSTLTGIRLYFKIKTSAMFDNLKKGRDGIGHLIFRGITGSVLIFGLILFLTKSEPAGVIPFCIQLRFFGLPAAAAGLLLITFSHIALGRNFSTAVKTGRSRKLITRGVYRYIRHPMYTGYLLYFTALFLLTANYIIGISGIAVIVSLMTVRLKEEEAILFSRFGAAYQDYSSRTGRFVPLIKVKVIDRK